MPHRASPRDYADRVALFSAAIGGAVVAGTAALLAGAVAIAGARRAVIRRRGGGMTRLAETIPVNSAYWREQHRRSGELLYVALGDSAAQGIGASRPGHSYVGLVARDIRNLSGRTVRVANLSQSGARLREALERQLPVLATLQPDIVTVAIGANDIAGFEAERFERELRMLFAALPAQAIVADVPSFYLGRAEQSARAANRIVRAVAAEFGLAVAPLHQVTRRRSAARTALRDVAADFFHPNDRGYTVWASAFAPLVAAAVARLEVPE